MLGFWMARILTKPVNQRSEKFRSSFLVDFVSSGIIGLMYTLFVGPLTEGVASAVGHALYTTVPASLDAHELTPLQRYLRPIELLLLAGATWWSLNRFSKPEKLTQFSGTFEGPEICHKWEMLITMAKAVGMATGYLLLIMTLLSILEPQGFVWTLATAASGIGAGTMAFLLVRRAGRQGLATLFGNNGGNAEGK
jgi:hypothetical protein